MDFYKRLATKEQQDREKLKLKKKSYIHISVCVDMTYHACKQFFSLVSQIDVLPMTSASRDSIQTISMSQLCLNEYFLFLGIFKFCNKSKSYINNNAHIQIHPEFGYQSIALASET